MKVFAIRNSEDTNNKDIAYLIYYEYSKNFFIEVAEDTDEWEAPLLISSFVKRGKKSINSYWSKVWVKQRIVPEDRQNLGQILKDNNLYTYDEYELLALANGRCAQDDYYLVEIDKETINTIFHARYEKKIEDVIPLNNYNLLLFFRNGKVMIINIFELKKDDRTFKPIINNPSIFEKVKIVEGGNGVCWGENTIIDDLELYESGFETPLTINDFVSFAKNQIVNTAEAAEILNCSRQNINDLVTRGKLTPVRSETKNTYFLKSDILKRLWI